MVALETDRGRCGECRLFDTNKVDKTPVGTIKLRPEEEKGEVMVKLGFCRAEKGLALGTLTEISPCKQPPGTFSPILEPAGASQKS